MSWYHAHDNVSPFLAGRERGFREMLGKGRGPVLRIDKCAGGRTLAGAALQLMSGTWEDVSYSLMYAQTDRMQDIPGAFGDVSKYMSSRLGHPLRHGLGEDPSGLRLWDILACSEEGSSAAFVMSWSGVPLDGNEGALAGFARSLDELRNLWDGAVAAADWRAHCRMKRLLPYGVRAGTFAGVGGWLAACAEEYALAPMIEGWRAGVPAEDISGLPVEYLDPMEPRRSKWSREMDHKYGIIVA